MYPQLTRLGSLLVQQYERYLPTAFDESMSILQKLNKIIEYLNQTGEKVNEAIDLIELAITNQDIDIDTMQDELVAFKNEFGGQLELKVIGVLDGWFADGKLAQIINTEVFDMKANQSDLDITNAQLVDMVTIAKWIDGVDDTASVQQAIDSASLSSGKVKLECNKTYVVNTLTPKEGVILDLNGSTLKLANGTGIASSENPLFYDVAVKTVKLDHFSVINGTLDGNNAFNQAGNNSGGVIWLRHWKNLIFSNITFTKCFRVSFNFLGCENIHFLNVEGINNGLNNGGTHYGYGASFEQDCKNIKIDNFKLDTMYGYGIHFYESSNIVANNIALSNLIKGGLAIGITLTKAHNVVLNNVDMFNIDGDNFECNASTNVTVNSMEIENAGRSSIVMGANNTGINNNNVNFNNVQMKNTGNLYAMKLNYIDNVNFYNCTIDKIIATEITYPVNNLNFVNCIMLFNLDSSFLYSRYNHINSQFLDKVINHCDKSIIEISNVKQTVAVAGTAELILNFGSRTTWVGELTVFSQYPASSNQGSLVKYLLFLSNGSMIIKEISFVDGSLARKITATVDPANKKVIFTNSTGVDVSLEYTLKCA